jgi:hypothetical protein
MQNANCWLPNGRFSGELIDCCPSSAIGSSLATDELQNAADACSSQMQHDKPVLSSADRARKTTSSGQWL